jgi:type IV fimbrial biogenesis protein FimT
MSKPAYLPQYSCGFTLIETITTLAVACILLAFGIPSFQTTIQSNRLSTAVYNMMTNLYLARSEAVNRGIGVVLCPSVDGESCANTTLWEDGFIMYVDSNKNRELDANEQVLKHINLDYDSIRISTTSGRKKTVYNPRGYAFGYNLTFTFCDIDSQIDPKAIIVSNIGRARVSRTKYDGSPLDCN